MRPIRFCAQIEAKLKSDPALRAEADAMKRAWDLLDQLPKPQPSADFTHRTMHRLTVVTAVPSTTQRLRHVSWTAIVATVLALPLGWVVAGIVQQRKPAALRADDPVLVRDLRVIEGLPVLYPADSIEFAKTLDKIDRFGEGAPTTTTGPADAPNDEASNRKRLETALRDSDRSDELKRNYLAFKALSETSRDRMRELDQGLHKLEDHQQTRLHDTMERYAAWLARLPKEDRERIDSAPVGTERLIVIDEILDRQWKELLPKSDRDHIAQANADDLPKLLAGLRKSEKDRRNLRNEAHRVAIEESLVSGLPLGQNEFRERIQICVDESLRPLLNDKEEARLNEAPKSFRYFSTLTELSEGKFPMPMPGPAPAGQAKAIRYWKDLPPQIAQKMPNPPPDAITKEEGKWPQFPQAIADYARTNKIEIPLNLLGPTKADEMPPSVQKFIKEELLPKLNDNERRQLTNNEGKWPQYPKRVKELSDKHRLRVPGTVLVVPNERNAWQRVRDYKPNRGNNSN